VTPLGGLGKHSRAKQRLAVLGSTGSIGVSSLDVIARQSDQFSLVALTANRSVEKVIAQAEACQARYVGITGGADSVALARSMIDANSTLKLLPDFESVCDLLATAEVDTVVAGIVGAAGLAPVMAAVEAGKRVLVANKEPMVMIGETIMARAQESGATLLPLDSEHNAIFQCLPGTPDGFARLGGVKRITLTASGGPFRRQPAETLQDVTPEMACAHPNWVMGRKISVDSATLMNKGLEIIEACHLFGIDESKIDVVVHPQSVIHSWVEYVDGSVIAQMANPDMRVPIAHALAWPHRFESGVDGPDLIEISRSTGFRSPGSKAFSGADTRETGVACRWYSAGGTERCERGRCGTISAGRYQIYRYFGDLCECSRQSRYRAGDGYRYCNRGRSGCASAGSNMASRLRWVKTMISSLDRGRIATI